jgi:general secretion pathway protein G
MSNQTNHKSGFSLMELLIVLVILVLLIGLVVPLVVHIDWQPSPRKVHITNLEVALDSYRLDMHQYPKTLDGLIKNETNDPRWQGPYLRKGIPKDPWGKTYQYQMPGHHGKEYDLYSYGADGQKGGTGEKADII